MGDFDSRKNDELNTVDPVVDQKGRDILFQNKNIVRDSLQILLPILHYFKQINILMIS